MAEESKMTVKLNTRQHIAGAWHDKGDTVDVLEADAYALAKRGVVDKTEEDVLASANFLPAADPFAGENTGTKNTARKQTSKKGE